MTNQEAIKIITEFIQKRNSNYETATRYLKEFQKTELPSLYKEAATPHDNVLYVFSREQEALKVALQALHQLERLGRTKL